MTLEEALREMQTSTEWKVCEPDEEFAVSPAVLLNFLKVTDPAALKQEVLIKTGVHKGIYKIDPKQPNYMGEKLYDIIEGEIDYSKGYYRLPPLDATDIEDDLDFDFEDNVNMPAPRKLDLEEEADTDDEDDNNLSWPKDIDYLDW